MPKKKLIDANELLELYEAPDDMPEWDAFVVPIPVVRQNILDMPVVDAIEITRCKNCRNYESFGEGFGYCHELNHNVEEMNYCSFAEQEDRSEYCFWIMYQRSFAVSNLLGMFCFGEICAEVSRRSQRVN